MTRGKSHRVGKPKYIEIKEKKIHNLEFDKERNRNYDKINENNNKYNNN